ncbi:uncharacterized protein [Euphorbia lathyris]|uniref:uncharacterized protein n=1 Tax=Euphorbia lathyris TaxID=212925 RepID=UPI0033141BDC
MENNKEPPTIPSNYVTLSQLQERWLKEKEHRKLKEKEPHERDTQHPHNDEPERNIQAPILKEAPHNHRSGNRKYQKVNRNFKEGFSGASPEVAFVGAVAVVERNESENTLDETKSKDLGGNMLNKKPMWKKRREKKKMMKKTNQAEKEKMMGGGGTGTQGEGEVMVRETHAPPAKSEKKNISERGYARKKVTRLDVRPKNTSVVESSDRPVEMEGEVKDVMEKSEDTVEIERKLGGLCIEVESDRSATQNNTFNGSSSGYRIRDRIVDCRSSKYSGFNRTNDYRSHNGVFNRRTTEYRSYNGGGYRRNGNYRESNQGFNRFDGWKDRDIGNGMVWVKKGEVAVGTDNA